MADKKISALTGASTPLAGTEVLPIVQSGSTVKVSAADITAGRAVSMASGTVSSGNLDFSSTAQRITADFSNATVANRLMFQNSVVNGNTTVGILPNGTATIAGVTFYSNSNPAGNGQTLSMAVRSDSVRIVSGITASGSYMPLQLYTNNGVGLAIDASNRDVTFNTGNLIQGTAAKGINFTANTPAAGMTSQLLNWYEEGTWTPTVVGASSAGTTTYTSQTGLYTRVGRMVTAYGFIAVTGMTGTGNVSFNLPFASSGGEFNGSAMTNNLPWPNAGSLTFVAEGSSARLFVSSSNASWANVNCSNTTWSIYYTVTYMV